jgi:hypothetical protein
VPNPATDRVTFEFEATENGMTELLLTDVLGSQVRTIKQVTEPGKYSVDFDASALGSGYYTYILRTPTAIFRKSLAIVK